jgi:hypothetical protein
MTTSLYRRALAIGSFLFALSAGLQAQDDRLFALRLVEEVQRGATLTTFTVEHGKLRAIALFSEPSHTLVAVVADNSPGASELRELDWFKAEIEPHLDGISSMRIPLHAGAAARIQTAARPGADTRVVAWVHVEGEEEPRRVELQVGSGFAASLDVKLSTYTLTCGNPGSCDDSITCSSKGGSTTGTCCLKTDSQCGICRKSVAYCGLRLCDPCQF